MFNVRWGLKSLIFGRASNVQYLMKPQTFDIWSSVAPCKSPSGPHAAGQGFRRTKYFCLNYLFNLDLLSLRQNTSSAELQHHWIAWPTNANKVIVGATADADAGAAFCFLRLCVWLLFLFHTLLKPTFSQISLVRMITQLGFFCRSLATPFVAFSPKLVLLRRRTHVAGSDALGARWSHYLLNWDILMTDLTAVQQTAAWQLDVRLFPILSFDCPGCCCFLLVLDDMRNNEQNHNIEIQRQ